MDRTSITLMCPGSRSNMVVLSPTAGQAQYGVGHPENTGDYTLFIGALDDNGSPLNPQNDMRLEPGDTYHWYYPPSGAAQIVAVGSNLAHGTTVLEYDLPAS